MPNLHPKDVNYEKLYSALKGTQYWEKSPDLLVGDSFYELEGFVSKIPKNAFRNMMSNGLRQSDRLIIKDCGLTERYMRQSIVGRISKGKRITEVWVLKENVIRRLY